MIKHDEKMWLYLTSDPDQPSNSSIFAVHMKEVWVLSYLLSVQAGLIRLGRCPG